MNEVETDRRWMTGRRTMNAMVQERYGPASEVLHLREVAIPVIGADEVLVRVHASSVNAMEWHLVNGKPYLMRVAFGLRPRNQTLGADVSGTVEAVGPGVSRFQPGDAVFGEIGAGAYAEFARARERHLVPKPDGVGFAEAGVLGVAGLTALQGLRDVLGVQPGQSVLINGASGGVGTYAIQIARVLGAGVTAVCSTRNVDQALALGADEVVDYQVESIVGSGRLFDAIFDIPGNHTLRDCKRLLVEDGTYLMVGGPKGDWTGPVPRTIAAKAIFAVGGASSASFIAASNHEDLVTLGELLLSGQVRSVIEDRFPLPDIALALDRQGDFHARAKTLIDVEGAF